MKVQDAASKSKGVTIPALPPLLDQAAMLAKFSPKDRDGFERQINACTTKGGEGLANTWREFCAMFMTLANRPAKLSGVNTAQFFIPDGKHRKQVFAMHCEDNGNLHVYLPNVLDDAIKAGLFTKVNPKSPEDTTYSLKNGEKVTIEPLDRDTLNPQFYFKDMTGWNRKAISVTLPPTATGPQKQAVEQLAALAATAWPADAV
jgi:hypothetical protein